MLQYTYFLIPYHAKSFFSSIYPHNILNILLFGIYYISDNENFPRRRNIMINIAVIGAAGRMGRRIIANAVENGNFKVVGAVDWEGCPLLGQDAGSVAGVQALDVPITASLAGVFENAQVDAVIDFATSGAVECAEVAVANNAAFVCGVTAMSAEERAALKELGKKGRLVVSGNMSVGVNLLFKLVKEAATVLGEKFDVEIVEMHHNQKIDAPSGTAVRLGEVVCEVRNWDYDEAIRNGRAGKVGKRTTGEIGMHALRGGDVVGDHTVIFAAGGERVELTHKASSRDTFAKGALRAAEFLQNAANGLYDMQDVLNLK